MPQDFAVIRGNKIYTLKPYRDIWGRKAGFRYVGFCEGERVGFFQRKKDFEEFIGRHAARDLTPQQLAAIEAEERGAKEGLDILHELHRNAKMGPRSWYQRKAD